MAGRLLAGSTWLSSVSHEYHASIRQSSGRRLACASGAASAEASVSFTGRAPFMPRASTCMYRSGSTSPGKRVISLPSGGEQHHRRVAADVEARAQLLRTLRVAVDVDGDEIARALDEVLAGEDRRLHFVARRAPDRAPIEEERLVLGFRLDERGVDIAGFPCDRVLGVLRRRRSAGDRGCARGCRGRRCLGRLRAGDEEQCEKRRCGKRKDLHGRAPGGGKAATAILRPAGCATVTRHHGGAVSCWATPKR